MIADAMMTIVSSKHAVSRMAIPSADVVWVLVSWVPWAIFMAILVSKSGSGRSNSTLTSRVTPVWIHLFWEHIFSLSNLRTIFHTVCLLYEKHISMILGSFDNFWSSPPIFNIYAETLIGLWTLWPMLIVIRIGIWLSVLIVLVLGSIWCSVSCSEPSKPWAIHLLLK